MSFPFDLHSAALSDSHLPCHAHAMLRQCRFSQGHSTARPSSVSECLVLWKGAPRYSKGRITHSLPCTCRAHADPLPCHAPTMPFFSRPQHRTAVSRRPCCGLQKNSMVGAWHGRGMASVNQTRPHCVNQMGKTHSKPLAARHGRESAWARHGNGKLCVNRPLE